MQMNSSFPILFVMIMTCIIIVTIVVGGCGGDSAGGNGGAIFFAECVFVVVHPYFEYTTSNSYFIAEVFNHGVITFLQFPSQLFRKRMHLFFLLLGEFRPETLPSA